MKSAECSLTASHLFNWIDSRFTPENWYFAVNKIIFHYLQVERDLQLDSTVVQALGRLLDVKPEYDWTPLNWYVNSDLPDNAYQAAAILSDSWSWNT